MVILLVLQSVLDGIMLGGVYASIAVGLSLSFGVMRVVNWAHGELLMASMYIAYVIVTYLGVNPYVAMLGSGLILFIFGYLLQKHVFNNILSRETQREPVTIMLFGAGLGMVLTSVALILFTSFPVQALTAIKGKMWKLSGMYISVPRFIAFTVAMALTLILYLIIQKTELGRAIRATSQNRFVAQLMGIPYKKVYAIVFALGLGIVGVSGGLMIPYFPISPDVGAAFGFRSFIIVVLGGKGSIPGALIGGIILGLIEKLGGWVIGDLYAQVLTFILFIIMLMFKPSGLFGKDYD